MVLSGGANVTTSVTAAPLLTFFHPRSAKLFHSSCYYSMREETSEETNFRKLSAMLCRSESTDHPPVAHTGSLPIE